MKTNLARNTIFLSIGNLMTKGINLLMIPLFSSWLSTEDYGEFDLYCTYIALLIPFISLSSADAIFRFAVETTDKRAKAKYVSTCLAINITIGAIVLLLIVGCALYAEWKLWPPLICLLIGELMYTHFQGFLRALKMLNIFSLISVVLTFAIAFAVTLLVWVFKMGLEGIIWGYAFGYLVGDCLIVFYTRYYDYLSFTVIDKRTLNEVIKYAAPMIPNNISWWIINVSDRTMINLFVGSYANGIYAIASKIPNFCASVFSAFSISWQEAAVDAVSANDRNNYYSEILNKTILTMASLCSGLLAINMFLFDLVFDQRYHDAYLYCPILVLSVFVCSLVQYFGGIQISFKHSKENGYSTICGAIANVVLLLMRSIGLYAAAISTFTANVIICFIRFYRLKGAIRFIVKRNVVIVLAVFLYLFICCYLCKNVWWGLTNILITLILFCYVNKSLLKVLFVKLHLV